MFGLPRLASTSLEHAAPAATVSLTSAHWGTRTVRQMMSSGGAPEDKERLLTDLAKSLKSREEHLNQQAEDIVSRIVELKIVRADLNAILQSNIEAHRCSWLERIASELDPNQRIIQVPGHPFVSGPELRDLRNQVDLEVARQQLRLQQTARAVDRLRSHRLSLKPLLWEIRMTEGRKGSDWVSLITRWVERSGVRKELAAAKNLPEEEPFD
jgi:hypothetical protein